MGNGGGGKEKERNSGLGGLGDGPPDGGV